MKTWLLLLLLFSTSAFADPSPYELEAQAYADYLTRQYNEGRITKGQMDYMLSVKAREIQTRAAAAEQKARSAQVLREEKDNQRLDHRPLNCSPSRTGPWGQMDCR